MTFADWYKFKVGDVVRLKGSDVPMTVGGLRVEERNIEVVWFDADLQLRTAWFAGDMLEQVPESDNPVGFAR